MTNALIVTDRELTLIACLGAEAQNMHDQTMRHPTDLTMRNQPPLTPELRLIEVGYRQALVDIENVATMHYYVHLDEINKATTSR